MQHDTRLSSSEVAELWIGYIRDSMSICTLNYFLHTVEDPDIRPVIQNALAVCQAHMPKIKALFQGDNRPIPAGFSDEDVDLNAPRLYSDWFILDNVKQTAQLGMQMYAQAKALSARQDVRDYFAECLMESSQLYDQALNVLLSKGLNVRSPYIDTPDRVDFVTKQHFMSGWFGEQRPLLALEIANLYANIQRNALGMRLLTGFGQVAQDKKVREFIARGRDISSKHLQIFTSVLQKNSVPASMVWDEAVTASTIPPFSDKLMLFQVTAMNSIGFAYYGTSVSTTFRRDLAAMYTRLMAEIAKYTEDGGNLLIEKGWMEEPPRMIDHNELMKHKD